jgi:hypothetical protein
MKKAIYTLFAIAAFCMASYAQRTYFEFEISKELFKKLELSFNPQVRFNEGFDLKQYLFDVGAEYKFSKYFSVGSSYRLGTNITKNDNKEYFGRFALDAKTSVKWKGFEPKFRLRYTNNNEDFESENMEILNYLRYKFEIEYRIKKLNLYPYIYTELFQNMEEDALNNTRYEGGLMYKINKHHRIGAYYRMNYKSGTTDPIDIIGLTYKLKL